MPSRPRPREFVILFPHLTARQEKNLEEHLENALIEWTMDNPMSWVASIGKPWQPEQNAD